MTGGAQPEGYGPGTDVPGVSGSGLHGSGQYGPELDSLVGLHSVKGSHYAQYRGVEQRLTRVVGALDRISVSYTHLTLPTKRIV